MPKNHYLIRRLFTKSFKLKVLSLKRIALLLALLLPVVL